MHLLSVEVEGFRSFREPTTVTLTPGVNVVVGQNGAGKSNLLEAIAIFLDADYNRHALKHDNCQFASVALRVDNSEGDFPDIRAAVVTLKKVVSSKNDSYYCQGKTVSKGDFLMLVRLAGLASRSPFNVLRQGQINAVATGGGKRRMEMVRALVGAVDFEEDARIAAKLQEYTTRAMQEAEKNIEETEAELESLGQGREQLKKFQKMDKRKRALQFVLDEKTRRESKAKVQKAEKAAEETLREMRVKVGAKEEEEKNTKAMEKEVERSKKEEQMERESRKMIIERAEEQAKVLADCEETQEESKAEIERLAAKMKEERTELESVRKALLSKTAAREEATDAWEDAKARVQELELASARMEQEHKDTFACQSKLAELRSDEEKQEWLEAEKAAAEEKLLGLRKGEAEEQQRLDRFMEMMARKEDELAENKEEQKEIRKEISALEGSRTDASTTASQLRYEQGVLEREMFSLQRRESDLAEAAAEAFHAQRRHGAVRGLARGLESLETVLREEEGMGDARLWVVGECVKTTEELRTALSVTLGPKLYWVIVETASLGTRLLKAMSRRNLPGELKFLALDKLMTRAPDPSFLRGKEAKPLLDLVEFAPEVERAAGFLLGRTVLVRNMDAFASFRGSGFDCVTLDGMQAMGKGVLRGGYHREDSLIVNVFDAFNKSKNDLKEIREEKKSLAQKISQVDSRRLQALDNGQRQATKANQLKAKLEEFRSKQAVAEKFMQESEGTDERTKDKIHEIKLEMTRAERHLGNIESLVDSSQRLNDTQAVRSLIEEIAEAKKEYRRALKEKDELERKKNAIEAEVKGALIPKMEEMKRARLEDKARDERLRNLVKDVGARRVIAAKLAKEAEEEMAESNRNLDRAVAESSKNAKLLEKQRARLGKLEDEAAQMRLELDRVEVTKARARQAAEKARFEGTFPAEEVAAVQDWGKRRIEREIKKVNAELAKVAGVDKTAALSYQETVEKVEQFSKKFNVYSDDREALDRMLETIEATKTARLNSVLEQLATNFEEIFSELVEGGEAEMTVEDDDDSISLSVRFAANEASADIGHLSGGQKTLVALAFVFAVQRCNPVAVYLLDEVDAALDAAHRLAVARLVRQSSERSQIVCTTFRAEFVEAADNWVRVEERNKASWAQVTTKQEARHFVTETR